MSVIKNVNLKQIKYYGVNDGSTNWFLSQYENNYDFILKSITIYKNYDELIKKDFILNFYVINLFLFNEDVNKNFYKNLTLNFKDNFNSLIFKIKDNLKIKNINHLIKLFQNWVLSNLEIILEWDFLSKLNNYHISYSSILEIFLIFPNFDNEVQVKNLIILLEKIPNFYIKFLSSNMKYKHKPLIKKAFFSFISKAIQNNEPLIQNFDLIDCYIKLQKEVKDEILIKNIIDYHKNQINNIKNINQQISFAELFINVVKKYGLKGKWDSTKNLEFWYEELKKKLFNSDEINWIKFPYPDINTKEYKERINNLKQNIKDKKTKTWFYQPKEKRCFLYPLENKKDIFTIISNNNIGTYSNSKIIDMNLYEAFSKQLFSDLFFDQDLFKLYVYNFANTLESVLYSLGISEEENIFFIERYYEIIEQINEERQSKEIYNSFLYMKNITLVLTAIEDLIKLFIKNAENSNIHIININNISFSSYLVKKKIDNFKEGTIFTPSEFIPSILSNDCKMILNYYLYSNSIDGGLEIRNSIIHGSFISRKFFNQYWLFEVTRLFIQLVEEVTMNYIQNELERINIPLFISTLNFSPYIAEEKAEIINGKKQIKVSHIITEWEKYANKELKFFLEKNNINSFDSVLTLKLNYLKETNEFELETSLFKTFNSKFIFAVPCE